MYILSFHLYKNVKKKLRPRQVKYLLKATQLASGRARIRPRQSYSRPAHLGSRVKCGTSQKDAGGLTSPESWVNGLVHPGSSAAL